MYIFFQSSKSNFVDNRSLSYTYIYDKSNRLLNVDHTEQQNNSYDMYMIYDKDGNILTMDRYGGNDNLVDNFDYSYISGTNKLSRVYGLSDLYTYDYNGNLTSDQINYNYDMVYDQRNLLIESMNTISPNFTFRTRYYYDEAGNRIRKYVLKSTIENPGLPNWDNLDEPGDGWGVYSNEYYVRDVSGKEIAIYSGNDLEQWNIWGLDNVGKVNSDRSRYFYIKDHLGSIRAVLDTNNAVVSAQDYDCWGYLLEGKSSGNDRYKFTSKERDKDYENNYDYFGARYYDSRIGRWGGVDIAQDSYLPFGPYCYAINNPMKLVDPNGLDIDFADYIDKEGKKEVYKTINELEYITGLTLYLEGTKLRYGSGVKGGSSKARVSLIDAIDNTKHTVMVKYTEGETQTIIGGYSIEYNPKDAEAFSEGSYGGLNSATLGLGMTFMHELLHTGLGIGVGDPEGFGKTGPIVDAMNVIRSQLGNSFGQRLSYNPLAVENLRFIPFDKESLEIMSNAYQKYGKGKEGFDYNNFLNSLMGTKYIKYEK